MEYWVYENWTLKRARVHVDRCSYCNNGKGLQPVDSGRNGKWHGPFSTRLAALNKMKNFGYPDMKDCVVCSG